MQPAMIAPSLLAVGMGVNWAWSAWPAWLRAHQSRRWPAAAGMVTGEYVGDADGILNFCTYSYSAGVTYEYEVAGQRHRCNLISYRHAFAFVSIRRVVRAKAPYPVGRAVTVYYDPRHPERGVLEPGVGLQNHLAAGVPFAALALGLFLLTSG